MQKKEYHFSFEEYGSIDELPATDAALLFKAREITAHAYAPYSRFRVGAVAKMQNGQLVTGSNQENASFPIGLCAERVLLATAASLYPAIPIETIAISYVSDAGENNEPVSPCGICRQALNEFEIKTAHPIRLILGGKKGRVFVIPNTQVLLPLGFTPDDLNG